jgi:protein-disulfide isomerase
VSAQRVKLFVASAVVAAVVVAIAIAASQVGSGPSAKTLAKDSRETSALLDGIPQQGVTLGRPDAPLTLTEFADLQCPFCRQYTLDVFPTLVRRYVRTGRIRMVFRGLTFIGSQSVIAARAAGAAGLQNRLWQFADVFYRNQGDENTGYVRANFLRKIAGAAKLDVPRLERDTTSQAVQQQLASAAAQASRLGVKGTPAFFTERAGQQPQRLGYSSLTASEFQHKIEALLAG